MKKKKRIKIIIIAVLVVAVAAGSITGVVYYRNSKGLASVMSVSMISTTNEKISTYWLPRTPPVNSPM